MDSVGMMRTGLVERARRIRHLLDPSPPTSTSSLTRAAWYRNRVRSGDLTVFLNYFALVILVVALLALFYTFVYIHDLPYEAAKARNHPQTDAIHVACWLSLFTLHAIWPLVYIWAVSKPKATAAGLAGGAADDAGLSQRMSGIETRLLQLEGRDAPATGKKAKS